MGFAARTRTARKALYAGATAALLGAAFVGATASPASAAPRDGACNAGEFCLYYGEGQTGAVADFANSKRDYTESGSCITFRGAGKAGAGVCVQNHAKSVWNRTGGPAYEFYNSDFGGTYDVIPAGAQAKLNANVYQDNASHILGDASLRFPLNVTQAQIKNRSPHWCWDSKTNCHHDYNAADIFAATGTAVVSPVSGTVKTKNIRSSGVGSTVTVKDRFGRLWYFAHMHHSPAPVVSVGQHVGKGDRIGTVGTSAHALGTPAHLHLDMRVGVNERVGCSGSGCASYGFVNNQPLLRNAFLERPAS